MKKTTKTIEIIEWTEACPHCDMILNGSTKDMVIWNKAVHIQARHKDKIKGGKRK